jgi:hypothetical protein
MYYLQEISFWGNNVFMPTIGYNEAKGKTEETHISYTPTVIIGKYYFLKGRLTDRQKEIDRAVKEFMGNKV